MSPDSDMVRERGDSGSCPDVHVELTSLVDFGPKEAGLRIALRECGDGTPSESLLQRGLAPLSEPPSSASFDDDEMGEAERPCTPFSDMGIAYRRFAWSSGSKPPSSNPGGQLPSSRAGGDDDEEDRESSGNEEDQASVVKGRSSGRIGTVDWLNGGGDGSSGSVGNT
jgi:hypothetical protein